MNKKLVFLSSFLKNPGQVAAIAPSSKYTIKRIIANMDFNNAKNIVEFGPGTGIVTQSLLRHMKEDAVLFCFETNPGFCSFLDREISDARFKIINESAENIDKTLSNLSIGEVDYILSGIPFSLIGKQAKTSILKKTKNALSKKGKFIVYQQYNWHMSRHLKEHFGRVSMQIELRNMPPTFIFVCEKS